MRGCDGGSNNEQARHDKYSNRYPKPLATKAAHSHPMGEGYGIWTT